MQNALSLGILQLINLTLPLISLPYLASTLGAEQLGRMAFALSAAQILAIITDYGFNLSATKSISVNRNNPRKISEIWCAVTLIRAILCLAGIAFIATAALLSKKASEELGLIAAAYSMVIGNVLFPQWLFQGLEKLKHISVVQAIARIIVFIAIFFLVKESSDVYWATFLQGAGFLLGGILALPFTYAALKDGQLHWPNKTEIIYQLKEGLHIFISTAAINIYTTCNSFFLGLIATPTTVGQFHVAEKIIRAIQTIYSPISNAIYPHVSRIAKYNTKQVLLFNKKISIILGSAACGISLTLYLTAQQAIEIAFGSSYTQSVEILKIFLYLPPIVVVSNILGIQTMIPLGMEKTFSRILIIAATLDFAIFIPSVYHFGVIGAAWSNVAVETFVTISMIVVLQSKGLNPLSPNLNKNKPNIKK